MYIGPHISMVFKLMLSAINALNSSECKLGGFYRSVDGFVSSVRLLKHSYTTLLLLLRPDPAKPRDYQITIIPHKVHINTLWFL